MSDHLYLSLWFPSLRLDVLGQALTTVMQQFRSSAGQSPVIMASAYPVSWSEAPVFQRIYTPLRTAAAEEAGPRGAAPEAVMPEALEMLHEDYAYEFQLEWELWEPEQEGEMDITWRRKPAMVQIVGFGSEFDSAAYEQEGHIRIDFGTDSLFLYEELELDDVGIQRIRDNVQTLVDVIDRIQKNAGVARRLFWSDSGEELWSKLSSRLQKVQ